MLCMLIGLSVLCAVSRAALLTPRCCAALLAFALQYEKEVEKVGLHAVHAFDWSFLPCLLWAQLYALYSGQVIFPASNSIRHAGQSQLHNYMCASFEDKVESVCI
jgi:hypothetical protein